MKINIQIGSKLLVKSEKNTNLLLEGTGSVALYAVGQHQQCCYRT